MGYLFNKLPFPPGSRMTLLWGDPGQNPPDAADVAVGTLVELGPDQDVDVEASMIEAHLLHHAGGFGGRYPGGNPWLFLLQRAPDPCSPDEDISEIFADHLARTIPNNPEAIEVETIVLDRAALERAYGELEQTVHDWPVRDLIQGLLAECTYVPLRSIVEGYRLDCAFPTEPHVCDGDVFTDCFSRWGRGEGPAPPTTEDRRAPGNPWSNPGRPI